MLDCLTATCGIDLCVTTEWNNAVFPVQLVWKHIFYWQKYVILCSYSHPNKSLKCIQFDKKILLTIKYDWWWTFVGKTTVTPTSRTVPDRPGLKFCRSGVRSVLGPGLSWTVRDGPAWSVMVRHGPGHHHGGFKMFKIAVVIRDSPGRFFSPG